MKENQTNKEAENWSTEMSSAVFQKLTSITHSIGSPGFYMAMAQLLADILGSDRLIVVRYASQGAPEFFINTAMTKHSIEFYLRELYRLDPLYRYGRTSAEGAVLNLIATKRDDADNPYYDAIQRTAHIIDEIAVLLPAPGRVFVGICCEQGTHTFQQHEIEFIKDLYPLLEALHTAHIDQILRSAVNDGSQGLQGLPDTMMLLDRANRVLYQSDLWIELEQSNQELTQVLSSLGGTSGVFPLSREKSLHWQQLDDSFGAAPNGWMYVVETCAAEAHVSDWNSVIAKFTREYKLTPRESGITALVMLGYPNELIADKLDISYGNVKNHKHRMYQKLDITTERELFSLMLHSMLGHNPNALENCS